MVEAENGYQYALDAAHYAPAHNVMLCDDTREGLGCEACDAVEIEKATEAGHDDACEFTIKATIEERLEHFRTASPVCSVFAARNHDTYDGCPSCRGMYGDGAVI